MKSDVRLREKFQSRDKEREKTPTIFKRVSKSISPSSEADG